MIRLLPDLFLFRNATPFTTAHTNSPNRSRVNSLHEKDKCQRVYLLNLFFPLYMFENKFSHFQWQRHQ